MASVLITGGGGLLGAELTRVFAGHETTSLTRAHLDITDRDAVISAARGHDIIINAAAYTSVDGAEADEEHAFRVNALGAENLAIGARAAGSTLVQVSTDYVFDGARSRPYDEDHQTAPLGAYGRSKADGERRVLSAHPAGSLVVRTSWLYGAHGSCFPRTLLQLARDRENVQVVTDQVGQPTWALDLAEVILRLVSVGASPGIYHATNSGQTTWFGFARQIFADSGLDPARVLPTVSSEFSRPAPRPAYSVLGHRRLGAAGIAPMRPWHDALAAAIAEGGLRP